MDESALIAGLKAQQDQAFRVAVHTYSSAMLAAARRISPSVAEDAVQEAWIASCGAIHRFEGRASLKTWLIQITMNTTYRLLRQAHRHPTLRPIDVDDDSMPLRFNETGQWPDPMSPWTADDPAHLVEALALRSCLDKLLDGLPARQRQVLLMTDFQPSTPAAICDTLGLSRNHYRVLLHRARAKVHAMLSHFQCTGDC